VVATPKQNGDRKLGFNMTPMIDVVFLLIIFFLISSHLNRQENQVDLDLPVANATTHPSQHKDARIVISVSPGGRLSIGAQPVTVDEFEDRMKSSLAKLKGIARKEFEVRIRTDKQQKYRVVEELMRRCTKNGVWKLKFAVYGDQEQTL